MMCNAIMRSIGKLCMNLVRMALTYFKSLNLFYELYH